ncbi:hypothetical protein BDN71DRAFT_1432492 [Pleurotus eryngii]|uniref:Uncharacterized protein n=1 Tax=Pleurotus eryngii TaxID=5323 RepID=A0A9P6DEP9_PLEER|nr:hypothetical protein BDN71DRAFT_1432492 [Pleurotus eryngii]
MNVQSGEINGRAYSESPHVHWQMNCCPKALVVSLINEAGKHKFVSKSFARHGVSSQSMQSSSVGTDLMIGTSEDRSGAQRVEFRSHLGNREDKKQGLSSCTSIKEALTEKWTLESAAIFCSTCMNASEQVRGGDDSLVSPSGIKDENLNMTESVFCTCRELGFQMSLPELNIPMKMITLQAIILLIKADDFLPGSDPRIPSLNGQ